MSHAWERDFIRSPTPRRADALREIAKHNCYIVVENTASEEMISQRYRNGIEIEFKDGYGRPCGLPRIWLDEFLREDWIEEGEPLEPDQQLHKLTRKGFERANLPRSYQVGDPRAWTSLKFHARRIT
jgi:hypothetical protein